MTEVTTAPGQIAQAAIAAIEWKYSWISIPPRQWPLKDGSIDDTRLRHENEIVTSRTIFERLEASGEEFLGPIEALRYVKRNKIKDPIVVLFWVGRQLCCLYIYVHDDDLELHVDRYSLGGRWGKDMVFLVRPCRSK